jgi:hypothetical protein
MAAAVFSTKAGGTLMQPDPVLERLKRNADSYARALLPGAKLESGELVCPADMSGCGKVAIVIKGSKQGLVAFWSGRPDKPSINGGNLIHLTMALHGLSYADARRRAAEWLGQPDLAMAGRGQANPKNRDDEQQQAEKARLWKLKRVRQMVHAARPGLGGTLAETYLAARGIDPFVLGRLTKAVRFNPSLEYWKGRRTEPDGSKRPGPMLPAIVLAITNKDQQICGVHCTFLKPDGSGKADVEKAKLMFGEVRGHFVEVQAGPHGLSCDGQIAAGHAASDVMLIEGLEDAVTFAMAAPELRIWMVTSLMNFQHAPIGHAAIRSVLMVRDNDWNNPTAIETFERAAKHLKTFGKPVAEIASLTGNDINNMVQDD